MEKLVTKLTSIILSIALVFGICGVSYMLPGVASYAYADEAVEAPATCGLMAAAFDGTKAADDLTVLTFTSDIHNTDNNTAANRLDTWFDKVEAIHGDIDVMSFCGDMGSASAGESQFWSYTQSVMNVVSNEGIEGVYTTGNHEFYNGKYSSTSNDVKSRYLVGEEGKNGSNYRIYCMGTTNWDNNRDNFTSDQITKLTNYLNSVDASKPIIILVHFPLHSFSSRATTNADQVIDTLNTAASEGKKIVLLWGHNHSVNDSNYDQIYAPGESITYNSSGNTKEIQFYYGAAGCMSDSEYGSGSAYVKGKGLVITINDKKQLSFTYYDANANNVTEGGTLTEQDPVPAEGISVDPSELEVEAGRSGKLAVTFTPSDTTNKGVTWTSSNTQVATVANGKVKGVNPGTATITATSVDGGFTATCAVTVVPRTSEDPYYVIKVGDYVLSTEKSSDEYTGSSSGSWWGGSSSSYTGLVAEKDSSAAGTTDETRWVLEETDGGYYIKSLDDRYLNATYTSSGSSWSSSSTSVLKLDDTPDVWVLDDGVTLDSWEVDGSYLKSTNSDRYLCEETGTAGTHLFSVRSKDNADMTTIEEASDPVAVTGVSVSPGTETIEARTAVQLTATVTPSNATNKTVLWSSSNEDVATVSNSGRVRGVAEGKATITATTEDGNFTATATITVIPSTSPEETRYAIIVDGYALSADRSPNTAQGGSSSYTYTGLAGVPCTTKSASGSKAKSSEDDISWIFEETDGGYYIKSLDGQYLNATYDSGSNSGQGDLKVDDTPDVWVLDSGYSLEDGSVDSSYLKSTNASDTATSDKFIGYEEGSANLFTVRSKDNADKVTIAEPGEYEIQEDPPVVSSVDITPTTSNPEESAIINVGDTLTINVTNGSTSSAYNFTATLDNSGVAEIQGNATVNIASSSTGQLKVKGVAAGAVDITIQNESSYGSQYVRKGVIHLTVEEAGDPVAVTGVSIDPETVSVEARKTVQLTATVAPADATNKSVYWSSSEEGVATVDANGKVRGVAEGTATITATTEDGNFTATAAITVTPSTSPTEPSYVITIAGYALSTDRSPNTAQGGSSSYTYTGLAGIAYDANDVDDNTRWIFEETEGGYLIKSLDGKYLNATYTSGSSSGQGDLKVDETTDVWVLDSGYSLEDGMVDGSYLKSTNASSTASSDKFLGYEEGSTNLFTVRSKDNADTVTIAEPGVEPPAVTEVDITPTTSNPEENATINVGDTLTINVTNSSNRSSYDFAATLSNDGIAEFEGSSTVTVAASSTGQLKVKGVAAGSVDITISNNNSSSTRKGIIHLTVNQVQGDDPVDSVLLNKSEASLTVGATEQLTATVLPATAADKSVTWTSSDDTVATVSEAGLVTAVGAGTATITVTTVDGGKTATCAVTVTESTDARFELVDTLEDGGEYLIVSANSGSAFALKNPGGSSGGTTIANTANKTAVTIEGGEYVLTSDEDIVWTATANGSGFNLTNNGDYIEGASGNVSVFNPQKYSDRYWTYNSDKYLQHKGGQSTYTLRYSSSSNYFQGSTSNTGAVYLFKKVTSTTPVAVTAVTLDKESVSLKIGKTEILTATVVPSNATNKKVSWSSSNESAATVDGNGKVTAVAEGTTTITVTTEDGGFTATCTVTVSAPTGDKYKLVDSFTSGKDYLIVSSNSVGDAYALTNPGGTSGGASMGSTGVSILSGDVDGDGAADTYIVADAEDIVWTTTAIGSGFSLSNNGDYLEGASGSVSVFNPQKYTDRYWTYTGSQLKHNGGQNTYTVYYDNGFTSSYNSNSNKIYLYEKVESAAHTHSWNEGEVTTEPTCTEEGVKTFTCSGCGETKTEAIAALGHAEETVAAVAATCTEPGKTEGKKCSRCGETLVAQEEVPALGHDFGEWAVTTAPTCTEPGVETRECSRCDATETREVEALGHTEEILPAVEPTCTEPGKTEGKKCSVCGETLVAQEDVAALGHDFGEWTVTKEATCTEAGVETHACSRCDVTETREVEALGHDFGEWSVTTAPTCTEAGVETRTCSRCDATETREVEALGHTEEILPAVEPTCTEPGKTEGKKCSVCGETLVAQEEVPALGHDYVSVVTEPTCTEAGFTTHTCSRCGDSYTSDNVAALGHVEEVIPAVAATCTEPGATPGTKCSRCGEILVEPEEIPALGHSEETIPGVAATCTEPGLTVGTKCSRCGEILVAQEEIPALGHEWNTPTYTWGKGENGEYISLTATHTCTRDASHVETETVDVFKTEEIPATDTEEGKITYTSADFENPAFKARDVEVIVPATGHELDFDPDAIEWEWTGNDDEGYTEATATAKCKHDDGYCVTVDADVTLQQTDANCTDDGAIVYTAIAVFEGGTFTDTKTIVLEALGHVEGAPVRENVVDPTCDEAGSYDEVVYCEVCGAELRRETNEITALGHAWSEPVYTWGKDENGEYVSLTATHACTRDASHVETETVEVSKVGEESATCTEEGKISYASAKFKNSAFNARDIDVTVPALGHDFGEWTVTEAATCTEPGEETRECSRCGELETREVKALGHAFSEVYTIDKPATCTEEGSESIHCSICGEQKEGSSHAIAKLEHSWDKGEVTREATYDAVGIRTYTCVKCGQAKTEEIPVLKHVGWVKDDGKWYFYNNDGTMATNVWKKDSKGWCYLGVDGAMVTDAWQADSKGMCYLDGEGHAVTSAWKKLDGKWYYFDSASHMVTSKWQRDSKGWCYLGVDGAMVTDAWQADSKGMCYLDGEGHAVTSAWKKLDGKWYYFDSASHMVTSKWQRDSQGWCYLDSNGRMVSSAWKQISDTWYYFDANGHMVTGTQTINGKTYKFGSNGAWIE